MSHFLAVAASFEQLTEIFEVVLFPLLLVELVWLWRSGRLTKARVKEMLANVSSLLIVIPLSVVGLVAWFLLFEAISNALPWAIPTTWGTAVVGLVLVDLIYYLEHRFEHMHRLPWDLYHSVHHSSPDFDQTTSLRLSGFDALLTIGFLTPLVVAGFSPELVLLAYGLVVGYQTWIHTELIQTTPKWFAFVFNTPAHHRVHHASQQKYLDANFGGIFILWDRLFGTFVAEQEQPIYGLTTQLESSHPLDVQFSEIRKLWRDLRGDSSWRTRLRRLWHRPGWNVASIR